MTKLFKPFSLFIFIVVSYNLTAQVNKHVQFSFSGSRDEKGAFVSIKARIADTAHLFSTKRSSPDDVFVSSVEFDSAARKYLKDSLAELGQVKTAPNSVAEGTEVRYFSDSVEWRQRLNILP